MNSRRDFQQQQDRYGRGRDDQRTFSRDQHRGGQYGGQQGWRGSSADWDVDYSREAAQYGANQDRFGGYSGSMNYGNPYESRQQGDGSRQNPWDEDRFGYPESGRSQSAGYGPQGRFSEDRYSWGQQYGQSDAGRDSRHFEPRRSSSSPWGSDYGQGSSGGSGESFAGGRSSYGGGQPNWSGSQWGHQGESQWGGGHSRRFGSDTDMRGRTPKGYTRSDDRIKDDVCEQLYRTPDIDVSEVTVEARNGTVTLEGTVPDRRMKHRIEDLCEQCIGVQDVENRIRVVREQRSMGSRFGTDEENRSSSTGSSSTSDRSNRKSTGTASSQH